MPGTSLGTTGDTDLQPDESVGVDEVDILLVLDSLSPSQLAAILAPMRHLERSRVAVLTTPAAAAGLPTAAGSKPLSIVQVSDLDLALPHLRCVLAVGDYMHLGAIAHATALGANAAFLVAQHGIVTPHAPPLPKGAELLAWSEEDGEFWAGGRNDVTSHTVGGQLLHEALRSGDQQRVGGEATSLTYLGQLHGHELQRRSMARAAGAFCRTTGALYRPHPSETDIASRMQHRLWRLRGIEFESSGMPLPELNTAVVSVFSTGVLEAAAAGIPAWVDFPEPPQWLEEIWQRYGMKRFGSSAPTVVPPTVNEPAKEIAEIVLQRAGGRR
ncbi:MAG: RNA-binding protein [Actinobacteria bacterium]|nr:RNA-binding protein [Actinomycetota bacterium]MTA77140.1 RNA-binding protein [Actinomycetota bacterium]